MSKRRNKHHTSRIFFIILLVLIAGGVAYAYERPVPPIYPQQIVQLNTSNPPLTNVIWPSGSAEEAIGAVGFGVLATNNIQNELPTASTAKLITALLVLKDHPLSIGQQGPLITITPADVTIYDQYVAEGGSVVPVVAGEQLSEYQALQGMLLPSANNLADTLAIWNSGSLAQYSIQANQLVQSLGLTNTKVGVDASGFLPSTVSTSADLTSLGETALKNPVLAQIVGQKSAVLPVAGTVANVNGLLGKDGIIGVKTGNTDQAGGVFVFGALDQLDPTHSVTIVGTIQGTPTLAAALSETTPLLNSAKANFSVTQIVTNNQVVGRYYLPWGGVVNVVSSEDLSAVTWLKTTPTTKIRIQTINKPLPVNTVVGSISNGSTSVPLVLQQAVPKPPVLWKVTHF